MNTLLSAKPIYKPFTYPWAFEAWEMQQNMHWLPKEVAMGQDIADWRSKLTDSERHLLTHIFRFFTQADIEVADCYMKKYSSVFKPIEVQMMLTSFANMETVHIAAYSHLIDTLGMPETTYSEFMEYKAMKDKLEYTAQFDVKDPVAIAKTLAVFGAFTEGLQLFATFAILLNFQRFGKMKGMGQIITWSVRDETLHMQSIIKLFRTLLREENIDKELIGPEIRQICIDTVAHEDKFIDLAFEAGGIEGLTAAEVKEYIRYIADRRMHQLGLHYVFYSPGSQTNPLPWLDEILNGLEHTNFFENRSTDYSKASTTGTWREAFSTFDSGEAA